MLPLPVPHLIAATTAVLVLGQSGLLSRIGVSAGWLTGPADMPALVYDRAGMGLILMLGWKEFPFLALVAFSVLATRGTALEETARSLGAGPWQRFLRVTWPILWRGLAPAAVAVFAFAAGSYEAAALLAPSDPLALPVLTLERYTDPDLGRRGDAFVLTLLGLALAASAVLLHEWLRHRVERLDR
ncbi:MAG: ABC transporter permease subunit [Gemmatimonadales bacterium]|nr:ABC transporter permease subunit [Gemmatimonadales bacterium]